MALAFGALLIHQRILHDEWDNPPESQLTFPYKWFQVVGPDENFLSENPYIKLNEDGSGFVQKVYLGEIDEDHGVRPCVVAEGDPYTGTVTWEFDENRAFRIHHGNDSAVFTPKGGGTMQRANWTWIIELFCDGNHVNFNN
ncbi:hypothetical protein BKA02_001568 [Microbacterium pseudoresistens]|uniref:Uncharacterized protein n=1 Tax=Microbacterium pseudoresistens TaxID=640634 RepID=A0A7Y9EV69_9MICO|nr:hypothetical protein [Microbacterium pseudoresistens]